MKLGLLACSFVICLHCIPGERPQRNPASVALIESGKELRAPAVADVPVAIIEPLFPSVGKYALEKSEKEFLEYTMHERYEAGFAEVSAQQRIGEQLMEVLTLAQEEEGVTYLDILDSFKKDWSDNVDIWPDDILERYKFAASMSIVYSTELLESPEILKAGIEREWLEKTIATMRTVRQEAIDEIERRGL